MMRMVFYVLIVIGGIHFIPTENLHLNIDVITMGQSSKESRHETLWSFPVSENDSLSIKLYWEYVDGKEIFLLLKTLLQLKEDNRKTDLIIVANGNGVVIYLREYLCTDDIAAIVINNGGSLRQSTNIDKTCLYSNSSTNFLIGNDNYRRQKYIKENYRNAKCGGFFGIQSDYFVSVVQYLQWAELVIFYEESTEEHITCIITALSELGLVVLSYRTDNIDGAAMTRVLERLDKSNAPLKNVTVICSTRCVTRVLSAAAHYVMSNKRTSSIRHYSQWLIFEISENSTRPWMKYLDMIDNVACMNLHVPVKTVEQTLSTFKPMIQSVASSVYSNTTLSRTPKNTIISTIINELQQDKQNCETLYLETLMWTKQGRSWDTVGNFDSIGRLHVDGKIFPNLEFAFNGRSFNISTLEWDPFVNKENGQYGGLCFDLLKELSSRMNFTYTVGQPPDGQWGTLTAKGSWTGLIGQLARAEVDLVVAPISAQALRELVMDFTYTFVFDYTTILIKKPDPMKRKWRTSVDPFSDHLWICVCITLPVMSLFLYTFERISPYYYKDRSNVLDERSVHAYQDSFWYMYGALLTQGGEHLPRSLSGRVLLSSWWVFTIMLMATYSGNLIAFMTVNKTKLPFTSLQEMVNQSTYTWGTIGGTTWETTFRGGSLREYSEIWKGIVKFNKTDRRVLSTNSNDHFDKVREGNYAYIGDSIQVALKAANDCSLKMSDEQFLPLQYAVGLPNNSPYTNLFSSQIIALHDSGLLHYWKTNRLPKDTMCIEDQITTAKSITVVDVQSAFYISIIGIVMGFIILISENIRNISNRHTIQTRIEQNNADMTIVKKYDDCNDGDQS